MTSRALLKGWPIGAGQPFGTKPLPFFARQPDISPSGGTATVTTFSATQGAVANGSVTARVWLLNGTAISTDLTAAPQAPGTLTYQEFATGPGGTASSAVRSIIVDAYVAPATLNALTVSNASGTVGATFTSTISNTTSGSVLSLSGAGTSGLSINGTTISGTPTTAGTINVTETLNTATNSPRTTNALITIAAGTVSLNNLTVSNGNATVGTPFTATISGATSGSSLSLSGAGAAGLSISGSTISGTPTAAGAVNIVETLAGATNSPRTTSGAITVAAAPTAVNAPSLTKTSAAGANPLAFSIAIDNTVAVGMYWHLQLATNVGFTTGVQDEVRSITSDDLASGNAPFGLLKNMPDGLVYARLRVERDDGVTSPYSNIISDTLSSVPVVTFDPATKSPYITLTEGNLRATVNDNAATEGARSTASKQYNASTPTKGYYFEMERVAGAGNTFFGVTDGTSSLAQKQPGIDIPGFAIYDQYVYINGNFAFDVGSNYASGGLNVRTGIYIVPQSDGSFKFWMSTGGQWITQTGDPSAGGAGQAFTLTGGQAFAVAAAQYGGGNPGSIWAHFAAADQSYRGSLNPFGA